MAVNSLVTGAAGQLPGQQVYASGYNHNPPYASTDELHLTPIKTLSFEMFPDKPSVEMNFEIVDPNDYTMEEDYLVSATNTSRPNNEKETKSVKFSVRPGVPPIQVSVGVVNAESADIEKDEEMEILLGNFTDTSQLPSSAASPGILFGVDPVDAPGTTTSSRSPQVTPLRQPQPTKSGQPEDLSLPPDIANILKGIKIMITKGIEFSWQFKSDLATEIHKAVQLSTKFQNSTQPALYLPPDIEKDLAKMIEILMDVNQFFGLAKSEIGYKLKGAAQLDLTSQNNPGNVDQNMLKRDGVLPSATPHTPPTQPNYLGPYLMSTKGIEGETLETPTRKPKLTQSGKHEDPALPPEISKELGGLKQRNGLLTNAIDYIGKIKADLADEIEKTKKLNWLLKNDPGSVDINALIGDGSRMG